MVSLRQVLFLLLTRTRIAFLQSDTDYFLNEILGYDYYTPETSVAFHMYAIKENKAKRKKGMCIIDGALFPHGFRLIFTPTSHQK